MLKTTTTSYLNGQDLNEMIYEGYWEDNELSCPVEGGGILIPIQDVITYTNNLDGYEWWVEELEKKMKEGVMFIKF